MIGHYKLLLLYIATGQRQYNFLYLLGHIHTLLLRFVFLHTGRLATVHEILVFGLVRGHRYTIQLHYRWPTETCERLKTVANYFFIRQHVPGGECSECRLLVFRAFVPDCILP